MLTLIAEHGYQWLALGAPDPQTVKRFAYYVLSCPEGMLFALVADRWFAECEDPGASLGRFACWWYIGEKALTAAGGLTDWGEDVATRQWAGRAIELWGPMPFIIAVVVAIEGLIRMGRRR